MSYMKRYKLLARSAYRKSRQKLNAYGILNVNPDIADTFNRRSKVGCDAYKCIFIHVPKTGGISICKDLRVRNNHMTAEEWKAINPELFHSYYKFTFVRNPVDRLISCYRDLCFSLPSEDSDIELGEFIRKNYSSIDHFAIEGLEGLLNEHFFQPQCNYIFDQAGNRLVDYIGKMESFDEDRKIIYNNINLRISKNTKRNESKGPSTRLLPDSIKKINSIYAEDIRLFSYENN